MASSATRAMPLRRTRALHTRHELTRRHQPPRCPLLLLFALHTRGACAWALPGCCAEPRLSAAVSCVPPPRSGEVSTMVASSAYGAGMTQTDMMERDQLVLVDSSDRVSGAMSKREAHSFSAATPRGCLHRAFSCFLFDTEGRMLLTKRAASKITFPSVWTNACCSHPLHGAVPNEVDHDDVDLAMPGAKHAARRKLQHELGIDPAEACTPRAECTSAYGCTAVPPCCQVPHEDFRFLSRFHYWAADVLTSGAETPWGEHEIDYILFIQADVTLDPNPDEVGEVRYVTAQELREMLADPTLRWSPWFVGIMERAGWEYWADLEEALKENGRFITREIVFFDPPDGFVAKYNLESHGRETGVQQIARESKAASIAE
ncbi:hypothetical protein AB1Y20_013603 [Prymnesium parvum]|uniref:isopentenyl-diphosphate Delta-isomerase n=1 Tax=Prymnesium parvum TaxID=97485 RepID=A0AB34IG18_PRYPA